MCRACELINIKRSMKKKDNGEVYKLGKTFAVFHLVPLLLEEGLAHGWLLSDVVGGDSTNATKPTQTVELSSFIACSY